MEAEIEKLRQENFRLMTLVNKYELGIIDNGVFILNVMTSCYKRGQDKVKIGLIYPRINSLVGLISSKEMPKPPNDAE